MSAAAASEAYNGSDELLLASRPLKSGAFRRRMADLGDDDVILHHRRAGGGLPQLREKCT